VAIGRNPWTALSPSEVSAQSNNPDCGEDKPFISVLAFGKLAENMNGKLQKSSKVVFCGQPEKNSFKKKDGTSGEMVQVIADNMYPLSCRATGGGEPRTSVTHALNKYTAKTGTAGEQNLVTLLAGKVVGNDSVKSFNGRSVVNFELELPVAGLLVEAVTNGTYKKETSYGEYKKIRCAVWGPRAEHLSKVIAVGNTLVVTGSVKATDGSDGRTYVNLTVRELSVMKWGSSYDASQSSAPAQPQAPAQASAAAPLPPLAPGAPDYADLMDVDSDELPF